MAKWWTSVILMASGLAGTATAQNPYLSNASRPSAMPEPIPSCAAQAPAAMPSGLPPQPQEQASPVSLPSELPNAWVEDWPTGPGVVYFSVGYLGLMRQRLGHESIGFNDTASGGVDTGDLFPPGARDLLNTQDINPRLMSGAKATLGYHCGNGAFELGGYFVGQSSSSKTVATRGALSAPVNVNGSFDTFPLGFEGDNGLWLQADVMKIRLQSTIGSGEANFRCWPSANSNFNWSLGVRYLDIYERFSFFTGDDDIVAPDINGNPDPTRQATYFATAHNHLIAPQLGLEWNQPFSCWLAGTLMFKGAWGANFVDVNTLLKRGDGLIGLQGSRSDTIFSHLYELSVAFDIYLCEKARIRAGWDFLWAVDIAEAVDQFDFNLANTQGRTNNHGSAFYQGPLVELHVLF
jgi:hypothetical protein